MTTITGRVAFLLILSGLLSAFATSAWARTTPNAQVTCVAMLTKVRGSESSVYMINQALITLGAEVDHGEANQSTWRYPQITSGISERPFSLNVDMATAQLESKIKSLERWQDVADRLGKLEPGRIAFSHSIHGREAIERFFQDTNTDIAALDDRVEPILRRQKFWDTSRKILTTLRSVIPLAALIGVGGGTALIGAADGSSGDFALGAGLIWASTLGLRDTGEVLPWWLAIVSKKAQRYLDDRSSYRTLRFTEGIEAMAASVHEGSAGWRSVHLLVPVTSRLAQEVLKTREVKSDDPDHDPLKTLTALTIDSNIAVRGPDESNLRWATVDLFLSIDEKGVPTLLVAGGLQKDFVVPQVKKPKTKREVPMLQEQLGLAPQPVPIR